MILDRDHNLAFLHVPKAAGSTVWTTLMGYPTAHPLGSDGVEEHPMLGRVDLAHATLQQLEVGYPGVYAFVRAARSYAVIRDPFDRFASSLAQRMRMYGEVPLELASRSQAWAALDAALERIAVPLAPDEALPHDWIHFQPQVSYTHQRGERVVKVIGTVGNLDVFFEHLLGQYVAPPARGSRRGRSFRVNASSAVRLPWLVRWVQRQLRPRVEPYLSPVMVRYAGSVVRRFLYVRRRPTILDGELASDDVRSAIARYYAADVELFRQVASRPEGIDVRS